jgi:hypothetical protein
MANDHSSNSFKTLSQRVRQRLSSSAPEPREQERIRQIGEELERRHFSTIAKAMSEGPAAARPREQALARQILEVVEEQPGWNIHQLARSLNKKAIVLLSHVDDLVREGVLIRRDDGGLFRTRDFMAPSEDESAPVFSEQQEIQAAARSETSLVFLRVYRYFTRQLELEPECGRKLTVTLKAGKFFEMKSAPSGGAHMSLFGMYPRELVDKFRQESGFGRGRVNYSRLTGVIDIRSCRLAEVDNVLGWISLFYQSAEGLAAAGSPPDVS